MSTWAKAITLVLVTIFFVTAIHSSITNAQTTQFYGRGYYGPTSYLNYCSFYITIYSPNVQTTYVNTLPLKLNLTWTEYPNFPIPALYGYYAYSIDNGPFVEIMSNQSDNDVFYQTSKNNFTLNPSFSYLLDISHFEKGYHNIVINASLYNYNSYSAPSYPPSHFYFTVTTSPYIFSIGETKATPTPIPTPQPTLSSSPTPTPLPTQEVTPTDTQNSSTEPSPSIPEFPSFIISTLMMTAIGSIVTIYRGKQRKLKQRWFSYLMRSYGSMSVYDTFST